MAAALLHPLTLVVGDEDLLVRRAVAEVVQAAREADEGTEVHELAAAEVSAGELPETLGPSLFGERVVLVVLDAQDLDEAPVSAFTAHLADPADSVHVVLCHAGGVKGKKMLAAFAPAARRVEAARVTRPGERREFLRAELRASGRRVTDGALDAVLGAVGGDLRELASAAAQLLSDTAGPIDEQVAGRYYRGRTELTGFAVAERAVEGDLAGALELSRWGQATGLAPVLVTSALADALRSIALVASAGGAPPFEVASRLRMPAWKVEKVRRQTRGWTPEALSKALQAVALADADVKGAGADADFAVERALLTVAAHSSTGRPR